MSVTLELCFFLEVNPCHGLTSMGLGRCPLGKFRIFIPYSRAGRSVVRGNAARNRAPMGTGVI
jgi:hypothetical protein